MKIKAAILDSDIEFMSRLAKVFEQKYADKINLSIFSSEEMLYQSLKDNHVDMILAEQSIKLDKERVPKGITIGCFSTIPDVDEIEGIPAICKYQKAEAIYKMLLHLYAEGASNVRLIRNKADMRAVLFMSVQGGSGTSAAAAAYAIRKSSDNTPVFYLNLEKFGDANLYFQGDGKLSFSDVIYFLKSRKGNLPMKIESAVQTDTSGVDFFHSSRNAYDLFELSDEDVKLLVEGISQIEKYKEIVIDFSGDMSERMIMLMRDYADKIVYVSDGSPTGNGKFERFCEAVRVMEQRQESGILEKICLLYNRYSSKNSVQLETAAVPVMGGIHRFEGFSGGELVRKIAQTDALTAIL